MCLNVYMYVFFGIVITCVLTFDSIKKFDDDDNVDQAAVNCLRS